MSEDINTRSSSHAGSKPQGVWQPPSVEEMQAMLPQYQFEALLGRGGMGAVYKAVQVSLDRAVAIKVLPGDLIDDADVNFTERFKNEARTMAKMKHPAIVDVYDFGQTQTGLLYFVMEFIDGTDVSKMIIQQGKLPAEHALAITAHVCDALGYAHSRGVIHRDIKPANILIDMEGRVKVADFGLAKQSDPSVSGLTKTNMAMGTPDFVAPEALIAGIPLDGRADLYAIGVMLYQMLTGNIPRGLWTMPSVMLKTDPRFDTIITKAMQTDREQRYQSAVEIRRDLDVILTVPMAKPEEKMEQVVAAPAQQKPAAKVPPQQRPQGAHPPAKPDLKSPISNPKPKSSLGPIIGIAAAVVIGASLFFVFKSKPQPAEASTEEASSSTPPASTMVAPKSSSVSSSAPTTTAPTATATTAPATPSFTKQAAAADVKGDAVAFGSRRFKLFTEHLTWHDAKNRCAELKGRLAEVRSKEENDFLLNLAQGKGVGGVWLGGTDEAQEGQWQWSDGSLLKYSSWDKGQPNNMGAGGEDYLMMLVTGNPGMWIPGVWWDQPNQSGRGLSAGFKAGYVCMWDDMAASSGSEMDLLAGVNVQRDGIAGTWSRRGADVVLANASPWGLLEFTAAVPEEYDFEIEFTPSNNGLNVNQVLTAGGRGFLWKLNAHNRTPPLYGFELLDGKMSKDAAEARVQIGKAIEPGKRYRSTVEVRKGSVRALLDGDEIVKWSGDLARFQMEDATKLRDPRHLGIGSYRRDVVFHKATLRAASGGGAPAIASTSAAASATKAAPFVNSLGMKFVPVPITGGPTGGQRVLFSVWETRFRDFDVFVKETKHAWSRQSAPSPDHAFFTANRQDAQAFCTWLTERERASGALGTQEAYRLPSDHEWSCAVGIGDREDAAQLPQAKDGRIADLYPWGAQWPPPEQWDPRKKNGPVGAGPANDYGLHDLEGTLLEWCEDAYDKEKKLGTMRGGHKETEAQNEFLSSKRSNPYPSTRWAITGFRCVLAPSATPAVAAVATTPAPTIPSAPAASGNAMSDPRLAQLEAAFKTEYAAKAQQAYDAGVAALNTSYVGALGRARTAAQTKGVLAEVTAMDDEMKRIQNKEAVPTADAPGTSAALTALRKTYHDTIAKHAAARDAAAAPVYDAYLKALDAYIAELTRADKLEDAKRVKALRDSIAAQKPAP